MTPGLVAQETQALASGHIQAWEVASSSPLPPPSPPCTSAARALPGGKIAPDCHLAGVLVPPPGFQLSLLLPRTVSREHSETPAKGHVRKCPRSPSSGSLDHSHSALFVFKIAQLTFAALFYSGPGNNSRANFIALPTYVPLKCHFALFRNGGPSPESIVTAFPVHSVHLTPAPNGPARLQRMARCHRCEE